MTGRPNFEYDTEKGNVTDIYMLPIGTIFKVWNGMWDGEIVKYNGDKGFYMPEIDKVSIIDKDYDYGLILMDIKLPGQGNKRKQVIWSKRMQKVKVDKFLADNEDGEFESRKVDFYHEHIHWLIDQARQVESEAVTHRLRQIDFHLEAVDNDTRKIDFYYNHSEWLIELAVILERGDEHIEQKGAEI